MIKTYVKAVPKLELLFFPGLREQPLSGSASTQSSLPSKARPFRREPVHSKNTAHEKVRKCGHDERAPDKVQKDEDQR